MFKGSSRLLLGRGPLDEEGEDGKRGVEVVVAQGDVIVLPAGVAHCSVESSGDYEYVGLYPEVSSFPLSRTPNHQANMLLNREVHTGTTISAKPMQKKRLRKQRMQKRSRYRYLIQYLVRVDRWLGFGRMPLGLYEY